MATSTVEHVLVEGDEIAGYGADVDRDLIYGWRAWRCLTAIRWLSENGYGPPEEYPEVATIRKKSRHEGPGSGQM